MKSDLELRESLRTYIYTLEKALDHVRRVSMAIQNLSRAARSAGLDESDAAALGDPDVATRLAAYVRARHENAPPEDARRLETLARRFLEQAGCYVLPSKVAQGGLLAAIPGCADAWTRFQEWRDLLQARGNALVVDYAPTSASEAIEKLVFKAWHEVLAHNVAMGDTSAFGAGIQSIVDRLRVQFAKAKYRHHASDGTVRLTGNSSSSPKHELEPTDERILEFLKARHEEVTGPNIARSLGLNPNSIKKNLARLRKTGAIRNRRRLGYRLAEDPRPHGRQ